MTAKLTIYGEFDGFSVTYEEGFDEAPANGFLTGTIEWLKSEGFEPRDKKAEPAGNQPIPFRDRVQPPAQAGQNTSDWRCPIHPTTTPRPGYQGRGKECAFYSSTAFEGSRDKPWVSKTNEIRWYCAEKSA